MTRALLALALTLAACDTEAPDAPEAPTEAAPAPDASAALPEGHPPVGHPPMSGMKGMPHATPGASAPVTLSGTVAEALDAGGYTYVHLKTDQGEVWAAGPQTPGIEVGDTVGVPDGMLMKDFTSPSTGRTFDEIFFVSALSEQ